MKGDKSVHYPGVHIGVFLQTKENMVLTCVGIGIVASVYCVILNTVHMPEYLRYGLTLGVLLLYAGCFEGTIAKKIFIILYELFFTAFCSVSIYWILDFCCGKSGAILIDSFLYALPNVMALVTIGCVFLIWSDSKRIGNHLSNLQWIMMMLYPAVAFFLVMSLYTISVYPKNQEDLMFWDAVALLVGVVVHFIVLYLLNQQNQKVEQSKLIQQEVRLTKNKAEALLKGYDDQRKLTHDFNNQLSTIIGWINRFHLGRVVCH